MTAMKQKHQDIKTECLKEEVRLYWLEWVDVLTHDGIPGGFKEALDSVWHVSSQGL